MAADVEVDCGGEEGVCLLPRALASTLGLEPCDCVLVSALRATGPALLVRARHGAADAPLERALLPGEGALESGSARLCAVAAVDVQEWRRVCLVPLAPVPCHALPSATDARLRVGRLAELEERHPWSASCHCGCALVRDGSVVELELQLHGGVARVPFVLSAEPHAFSRLYAQARGLNAELSCWGHVSAATSVDVHPACAGQWIEEAAAWPAPPLAIRLAAPERLVRTCGPEGQRLRALMAAALGGGALWPVALPPPRSILLTGPAGVGKRALVHEIASHLGALVQPLDAAELCCGEPAAAVRAALGRAACGECVLLLLQGLPLLAPADASSSRADDELARLAGLAAALRELDDADELAAAAPAVLIVGVAASGRGLHRSLLSAFAEHVALEPPRPEERLAILAECLAESGVRLLDEQPADAEQSPGGAAGGSGPEAALSRARGVRALAARLHGYVRADIYALALEARGCALERLGRAPGASGVREPVGVRLAELEASARRMVPSSLRGLDGARPHVPRVRWADVGGLDGAKAQLEELLIWPHTHGALLDSLGVRMAQGVLLYGPPGTGKTLLAQAMASEARLNFVSVQIPDLVKGDVGGSEEAIAAVFAQAKQFAPSLLFLDELQAMFGKRGSAGGDGRAGGSGSAQKSLTQLLLEMDACRAAAAYQRVVLVGATNVPDALDRSLLQPGRFEHLLLIGPPDERARAHILAGTLRGMPLGPLGCARQGPGGSEAPDLPAELAVRTEGFSAADLKSLCHSAAYHAIGEGAAHLTEAHFDHVLRTFEPSIHAAMMDRLSAWETDFFHGSHAGGPGLPSF